MFKFSFSSPPCLRDWVWIIGSWRKRWETWLIRRSPWLTGRPKSLRSSSGECSALMHYRNPSVCGGAAAEFFSLHMALGSAEVKPHTRLGFCWGFGWDFNNAQIQKIVFLLKSGNVSQNRAFSKCRRIVAIGCGFVVMEECWKESCAELTPLRGKKPGKSSGWVFVSALISFICLACGRMKQIQCNLYVIFLQGEYLRLPQSLSKWCLLWYFC